MTDNNNNDNEHKYSTDGSSLDDINSTEGAQKRIGTNHALSDSSPSDEHETSQKSTQERTEASSEEEKYLSDSLVLGRHTTTAEVREFLLRRVSDPIEIEGKTIYYFNNHKPNLNDMRDAVSHLRRDVYVVPYQVTSVWSAMSLLLPTEIAEAEYLLYSPKARGDDNDSYYFPRHNFAREDAQYKREEYMQRLEDAVDGGDDE